MEHFPDLKAVCLNLTRRMQQGANNIKVAGVSHSENTHWKKYLPDWYCNTVSRLMERGADPANLRQAGTFIHITSSYDKRFTYIHMYEYTVNRDRNASSLWSRSRL